MNNNETIIEQLFDLMLIALFQNKDFLLYYKLKSQNICNTDNDANHILQDLERKHPKLKFLYQDLKMEFQIINGQWVSNVASVKSKLLKQFSDGVYNPLDYYKIDISDYSGKVIYTSCETNTNNASLTLSLPLVKGKTAQMMLIKELLNKAYEDINFLAAKKEAVKYRLVGKFNEVQVNTVRKALYFYISYSANERAGVHKKLKRIAEDLTYEPSDIYFENEKIVNMREIQRALRKKLRITWDKESIEAPAEYEGYTKQHIKQYVNIGETIVKHVIDGIFPYY